MFISYAQNFEDVILNRLFSDRSTGFYLDVGAQHPFYDSVTKAFYDRGWQGINIEPVKEFYQLLKQTRERDINLNFAVGETESTLEFYELEGTGLSTFDSETAKEIADKDSYQIKTYQVEVKKLADVCQQYVTQPIDFLKIDVEGWEENVILGHDWDNFRPIVVLLEATIPNSPVRKQTNIRAFLEAKNYEYVYFDGLNDYYLAREHNSYKKHFQTPPNVFDKFVSSHLIEAQSHNKNLEDIVGKKETEIKQLTDFVGKKETEIEQLTDFVSKKETEIDRLSKLCQQKEQKIHILYNKYQDQYIESDRIIKNAKQQQQSYRKEKDILIEQIKQLQIELSQAQQTVAAMETSKFWRMRSNWFKVKKIMKIRST